jgi:7-keto-8-aminopelargonate synthetase-like enzyme
MKSVYLKVLEESVLDYLKVKGKTLDERYKPFLDYTTLRDKYGVLSFANRVLTSTVSPYVSAEVSNNKSEQYLNFSSQDYLGLAQNEDVKNAAKSVIDLYGIHTAAAPVLTGRNKLTEELENKLAGILHTEQCLLFPTGWAACFGVIAALITENDYLLIDALSHNSLQVAAKYSTRRIQKFKHNNLEHLEKLLKKLRENNSDSGIFVVIETLYSMNSDKPDLQKVVDLTNKYKAILIIDIAHDFGSMGEKGLGLLETIEDKDLHNIVLCGSFSKSFASNGGFVAGPEIIRSQLIAFSYSYTFSNGISPIQCAVALKCFDIIFSDTGKLLREKLKENIDFAIQNFNNNEFFTIGVPSPIVPVFIGAESFARLITRENTKNGLLVNLAEFPAVPKGKSIFRFQLMCTHQKDQITRAIQIIKSAKKDAELILNEVKENFDYLDANIVNK